MRSFTPWELTSRPARVRKQIAAGPITTFRVLCGSSGVSTARRLNEMFPSLPSVQIQRFIASEKPLPSHARFRMDSVLSSGTTNLTGSDS